MFYKIFLLLRKNSEHLRVKNRKKYIEFEEIFRFSDNAIRIKRVEMSKMKNINILQLWFCFFTKLAGFGFQNMYFDFSCWHF